MTVTQAGARANPAGPGRQEPPTPLAVELRDRIRRLGPLTVAEFMAACLTDPRYGYYQRREPFGPAGDFITAPEVSQMFGELIGLWAVAAWEAMGAPGEFALVELGPGRGTLMADILRAARIRPAFMAAVGLHLVEASHRLRAIQAETIAAAGLAPTWHADASTLPRQPSLVVANEFFDALPIRQFVATPTGWRERVIALGTDGDLAFAAGASAAPAFGPTMPAAGAIAEASPASVALAGQLAANLRAHGGAALFIDYGYQGPALGDTLQALYRGRPDHPLAHPGEADVTAHVDFTALAQAALAAGAISHPLLTQAELLLRLGIGARAERLQRGKNEAARQVVEVAMQRLIGEHEMGTHFRALCISSGGFAVPAFDPV